MMLRMRCILDNKEVKLVFDTNLTCGVYMGIYGYVFL